MNVRQLIDALSEFDEDIEVRFVAERSDGREAWYNPEGPLDTAPDRTDPDDFNYCVKVAIKLGLVF